jgi:hypothetical protein
VERVLQGRRDTLQHLYFNNDGLEANAVDHINACLLPTPVRLAPTTDTDTDSDTDTDT